MKRCPNYGNDILDSLNFSLPRRGCGSKPRVAASGTLGTEAREFLNRKAVASVPEDFMRSQPRCGCEVADFFLSQGSRSGNPGLRGVAPSGQRPNRSSCKLACVSQVCHCP